MSQANDGGDSPPVRRPGRRGTKRALEFVDGSRHAEVGVAQPATPLSPVPSASRPTASRSPSPAARALPDAAIAEALGVIQSSLSQLANRMAAVESALPSVSSTPGRQQQQQRQFSFLPSPVPEASGMRLQPPSSAPLCLPPGPSAGRIHSVEPVYTLV